MQDQPTKLQLRDELVVIIPKSTEAELAAMDFAIPPPPAGTVMEAADDLLAKAEELHALLRAEDDGMIPHEETRDTRSPIVRAHTALMDKARQEGETDEGVDNRLEREAHEQRIAKAMEGYTERPLLSLHDMEGQGR